MDIDPTDILSTNVFIPIPEVNSKVSIDANEEFRRYYEKELKLNDENQLKYDLKNFTHLESNDDNIISNIQSLNINQQNNTNIDRFTRETKTLVSIDSRDRIKTINPKPNHFEIFLGKTFTNVKKIELVSLEFPNTDAVINSNNNKIYWRNQEDIDLDITITTKGVVNYPIYAVELRVGSYTASTLQTEIMNKLNLVRRKQGTSNGNLVTGDFHYFVVTLDIDTDIVTFISLILSQLGNNPFTTSIGSGVITVMSPAHGYTTNDLIYITGTKNIAGISAAILNGFHQITVINANTFTFETTIKAGDTTSGGGNTCKTGKKAPFQMLWGQQSENVAQNIGFPIENSSKLISTTITRLENLYQMTINTVLPHNFSKSYDYIGQIITVGYMLANLYVVNRIFQITDITGPNSILVQVSDNNISNSLNNNSQAILLKFGNYLFDIASFDTYIISSILVTTQTDHNYLLTDVGNIVTLANTADDTILNDTSYDGNYALMSIPSTRTFVIPGVIGTVNAHSSGTYGSISCKTPLTSSALIIAHIETKYLGLPFTKITLFVDHKLQVGDYIFINNLKSNPVLVKSYQIITILNSTSFIIPLELFSIDYDNIQNGLSYIGTGLVTLSYPSHGFNKIVNISNGIPYDIPFGSGTTTIVPIIIKTFINHNLSDQDIIRLSDTNTTPSLNGGGYVVKVLTEDTFSITRTPVSFSLLTNIPTAVTGIIGLTNQFYIYDSDDVGGISKTLINNTLFTVRDIIDQNTFTFMIDNVFASFTEKGGGSNIYISSLKHGFDGIQTNTKNGVLNRSINLQGENYCFLTCPQLGTMLNTGHVENIFARISLDQPPGYVCFKYLSNPKVFNTIPLDKLSELEFFVVNYDSSLYEFSDLDFSYTLEITEVIDGINAFNVSSRRGISDAH